LRWIKHSRNQSFAQIRQGYYQAIRQQRLSLVMAKKFPLHPAHPERVCWGCDKFCSTDAMGCGNGSSRTQHPAELLGEDWYLHGDWGIEPQLDAPAKTGLG